MAALMNGALRMISIRFVVQEHLVPSCIKEKTEVATRPTVAKTPREFSARQKIKGERLFDPVEKVGCMPFFTGLVTAGYIMVDAFSQLREDGRFVVRFDFASIDYASSSTEFQQDIRSGAEKALRQLLEQAMWRVTPYLNHYFEKGEPTEDQFAVSINLDSRYSIFDRSGRHIMQWERDESGKRVGDAPVKVHPRVFLKIQNGDIVVSKIND